jgi:hypothetical protein
MEIRVNSTAYFLAPRTITSLAPGDLIYGEVLDMYVHRTLARDLDQDSLSFGGFGATYQLLQSGRNAIPETVNADVPMFVAGIHLPLYFTACRVGSDGTIRACSSLKTLVSNAALEETARCLASIMSKLSYQQSRSDLDSMNNCGIYAIANMNKFARSASVDHDIEPRIFSRRAIALFLWESAQESVPLENLPALLRTNVSNRVRAILEGPMPTTSKLSSHSHAPSISLVHLEDDHSSHVAALSPTQPHHVHLYAIWTPAIRPCRRVTSYILRSRRGDEEYNENSKTFY